jgi:hypothetical protein
MMSADGPGAATRRRLHRPPHPEAYSKRTSEGPGGRGRAYSLDGWSAPAAVPLLAPPPL